MATAADPLIGLLVNESALAREELAEGLAPRLQLTEEGGLWLLPGFEELTSVNKVLCLLLAVKAMKMLGLRESDRVSPSDLVGLSGMPAGTIRPKLSHLAEKRLIGRDKHQYWISTPGARKALQTLRGSSA
jgi:hypothetical protein